MKKLIFTLFTFIFFASSYSQTARTIDDFETGSVTFTSAVNINPSGSMTQSVVANTLGDPTNTSNYIWKWVRQTNTEDWAGAWCILNTPIKNGVKIEILYYRTDPASTLKLKLEQSGTSLEILPNTAPTLLNQWEKLTYDITGFPNATVLSFFPDYHSPSTVGTISYLDNIIVYENVPPTELVLFDESPSNAFYDFSWIGVQAPSVVTAVPWQAGQPADKYPVVTSPIHSGTNALQLQWTAAAGGNFWALVASTGWKHFDLSTMNYLKFWVNPTANIPVADLPKIYIQAHDNTTSGTVNMGSYVTGTELVANTWTQIVIPLADIWAAGTFAGKNDVKGVFFSQNTADNVQHTMYMDDIIFSVSDVATGIFSTSIYRGHYANGQIFISSYDGNVTVFDFTGKKVFNGIAKNNVVQAALHTGIYIVNTEKSNFKIIVK